MSDEPLDLSAWEVPPPPDGLPDRVLDAVRGLGSAHAVEAPPPRRRWRWSVVVVGLAMAAAAALALALSRPAQRLGAGRGVVMARAATTVSLTGGVEALVAPGTTLIWTTDADRVHVAHAAGVVTYRQGDTRRLTVVTPAATLTSAGASFRVEAPMNRSLVTAGVAGVVGVVAVVVYQGQVEAKRPASTPEVVPTGAEARFPIGEPAPVRVAVAGGPVAKTVVDAARRAEVARAIAAARARAGAAGSPAGAPPVVGTAPAADGADGALTKDDIRAGVREVVPLLAECYDTELARDPSLPAATVASRFTIESAADIGTVVTVGDLTIDGPLGASQEFRDCMTATLEAVVLPPLGEGGRIEVNYPFTFRPSDDDGGATPTAPAPTGAATPSSTSAPRPSTQRPAAPPPAAPTPDKLVEEASRAAMNGQFDSALRLCEQALATAATAKVRTKAINIAALSACRLKRTDKARQYYRLAPPSNQSSIRQACLAASAGAFDPSL